MISICLLLISIVSCSLAEPPILEDNFNIVDELGNVHFGYNDGQTARHELRTKDGIVRGSYQYIDATGEITKVSYTSDPVNGYQIVDSPMNEPDTSNVTEADTEILSLPSEDLQTLNLPTPVQDTPEVAAAKAAHLETLRLHTLGIRVLNNPIAL